MDGHGLKTPQSTRAEAYFIYRTFLSSGSIGNFHAMMAQLPLVELKVALRGDVDSTIYGSNAWHNRSLS